MSDELKPTNTNAERVSDIVPVAWRWKNNLAGGNAWHLGLTEPVPHPQFTTEPLYTADIIASYRDAATEQSRIMADIEEKNEALQAQIEAQSKALAEAREALLVADEHLTGIENYGGEPAVRARRGRAAVEAALGDRP